MIKTLKVDLIFGINTNESWQSSIEICASNTLHDLHLIIQKAIKFDNKHLYEFYVAGTKANQDRVRYYDDGATHQKKLSELFPMEKGKKLFYFFDYRDCWLFKVSEKNNSMQPENGVRYPRIVQVLGQQPKQYRELEEAVA